MNRCYSIVWNAVRNMFVVASELARGDSRIKAQINDIHKPARAPSLSNSSSILNTKRSVLTCAITAALVFGSPLAMASGTVVYNDGQPHDMNAENVPSTIDYTGEGGVKEAALFVDNHTTVTGAGYTINAADNAEALEVDNDSNLSLTNSTITAMGAATTTGATGYIGNIEHGSSLTLTDSVVQTNCCILVARYDSVLTLKHTQFNVLADSEAQIGAQTDSTLNVSNGSSINMTGGWVNIGSGSFLYMSDSTVTSTGSDKTIFGYKNATLNIQNSAVTHSNADGAAIEISSGSRLNLSGNKESMVITSAGMGIKNIAAETHIDGATINAGGDGIMVTDKGRSGFYADGSTLTVNNASVKSGTAALHVDSNTLLNAPIVLSNSTFTAPEAIKLESDATVQASNSHFTGNVEAGSSLSSLSLAQSQLDGSVNGSNTALSLDDASQWNVTDDSILGSLTNNGAITLSNANSPAQALQVNGAMTLQNDSQMNITLDTAHTAPVITANSATLDGGLTVNSTIAFAAGDTSDQQLQARAVTLIDSQTAITGDFDSLTTNIDTSMLPDYLTVGTYVDANDATNYVLGKRLSWYAGTTSADEANGTFTIGAGDSFEVTSELDNVAASSIWDGSTLTKKGDGTLILSNANNDYGKTIIEGGTLVAADVNALGRGDITNSGTLILDAGGKFDLADATLTTQSGATTSLAAGSTLNADNVVMSDNSTLDITLGSNTDSAEITANNVTLDGTLNISGIGNVKDALTGESYTFTLIDSGSTIQGDFDNVTIAGMDQKNVDFITVDGKIDSADQSNYDLTASLSWYADRDNAATPAHGTFTLSDPNDSFNVGADLVDVDANSSWDGKTLTKQGGGTLILSGNNSYNGGTEINEGTLTAASENALGTGRVDNHATLVLDANGVVNATGGITTSTGATTKIAAGSQLDLGNGTLTQQSGSTLSVDLDDTSTLPLITGSNAMLDGTLYVNDAGLNARTSDTQLKSITLMDMDHAISGDFSSLAMDVANTPDYLTVSGMINPDDNSQYLLEEGLSWNAGATSATAAHGTFTLNAGNTFEVTSSLADQTGNTDWDGKTLTKQGDGTLILSGVNTYSGDTNVQGGTLWLTGVIGAQGSQQSVNVASGATVIGSNGAVVNGDVVNGGSLNFGDSTETNATFTINGNLTNAGSIVSGGSTPGNTLYVNGNYTGSDGSLYLNTVTGDDSSATDKLVVTGDTSGNTTLYIHGIGDQGAQTENGIEVVDVGGASNGTFTQGNQVQSGLYEYRLYQDNGNGDWYLKSATTDPDDGGDVTPSHPQYRADIGAYLGNQWMARSLQMQTLYDREGSQFRSADGSAWARFKAGTAESQAANGNVDIDNNYSQFQVGGDILTWENGEQSVAVGLMGSYINANSDSKGNRGADGSQFSASGKVDGYNLGIYATWFADAQNHSGMYLDSWYQYGIYNNSVDNGDVGSESYGSTANAISLETGYRYDIALANRNSISFTPQAQVVWQNYDADSVTDNNGTRIDGQNSDSWTTRLGLRVDSKLHKNDSAVIQPFAEVNWLHTNDSTSVSFDGAGVKQDIPANRAELKMGIQANIDKQWSLTAQVAGQKGSDDYNDLNGSLNLRYSW